jgi:hypothetical protein
MLIIPQRRGIARAALQEIGLVYMRLDLDPKGRKKE